MAGERASASGKEAAFTWSKRRAEARTSISGWSKQALEDHQFPSEPLNQAIAPKLVDQLAHGLFLFARAHQNRIVCIDNH